MNSYKRHDVDQCHAHLRDQATDDEELDEIKISCINLIRACELDLVNNDFDLTSSDTMNRICALTDAMKCSELPISNPLEDYIPTINFINSKIHLQIANFYAYNLEDNVYDVIVKLILLMAQSYSMEYKIQFVETTLFQNIAQRFRMLGKLDHNEVQIELAIVSELVFNQVFLKSFLECFDVLDLYESAKNDVETTSVLTIIFQYISSFPIEENIITNLQSIISDINNKSNEYISAKSSCIEILVNLVSQEKYPEYLINDTVDFTVQVINATNDSTTLSRCCKIFLKLDAIPNDLNNQDFIFQKLVILFNNQNWFFMVLNAFPFYEHFAIYLETMLHFLTKSPNLFEIEMNKEFWNIFVGKIPESLENTKIWTLKLFLFIFENSSMNYIEKVLEKIPDIFCELCDLLYINDGEYVLRTLHVLYNAYQILQSCTSEEIISNYFNEIKENVLRIFDMSESGSNEITEMALELLRKIG